MNHRVGQIPIHNRIVGNISSNIVRTGVHDQDRGAGDGEQRNDKAGDEFHNSRLLDVSGATGQHPARRLSRYPPPQDLRLL
jgi:hypothetical protein